MDALEQYAALERFAQDPDLGKLEGTLSEFNLFRLLSLDGYEGTHSTVLAWLLNPREKHRLGDAFLRGFLSATTTLELSGADLSAARVQREWPNEVDGQTGYLDILILDEGQQFLCAVENKLWYWEHSGQLTRYRRALKQAYPDFTRHFLFLSPWGTPAQDATERGHWEAVNYGVVCKVVEETVESLADSVSEDARVFLRQYANCLRRYVLGDKEVRELARKIYTEHSEAIELINQNKPDYHEETRRILNEVIPENLAGLVWDSDNRNATIGVSTTRFLPGEWSDFASLKAETHWLGPSGSRSKSFLLIEVKLTRSNLSFNFTLNTRSSPESEPVRQKIDTLLTEVLGRGQFDGPHRVFPVGSNILNQSDLENWDEESVRLKIEAWVAEFAGEEYPRVRDAVSQCLAEFEAPKQP